MKIKIYSFCMLIVYFTMCIKSNAQTHANKTLSNLTSPVKINENLLPDKNDNQNLGSAKKGWKNLYIDSAVYLSGSRFLASPPGDYGGNTAVGFYTIPFNTLGDYNTANGNNALHYRGTGKNNTASGNFALYANTYGSYNTATGAYALNSNDYGNANTAIGAGALQDGNTTSYNTGVGYNALHTTTYYYYNTAVGFQAGYNYDNGYNNVLFGANADLNDVGYYNDIAIGLGALCTDVNQVRIGNSSTVSIGGYAYWSNISDGRVKKNIKQNVPGLAFITKLQPVTYNLDLDAADKIAQPPLRKDKDGKAIQFTQQEIDSRKAKEQIVYTGFIAQDVERSAKELNYNFSGVDAAKNSKDLYGLRYAEFVVPLVKAGRELDEKQKLQFKSKKDAITVLQNENKELKARLEKLETILMSVQHSTR